MIALVAGRRTRTRRLETTIRVTEHSIHLSIELRLLQAPLGFCLVVPRIQPFSQSCESVHGLVALAISYRTGTVFRRAPFPAQDGPQHRLHAQRRRVPCAQRGPARSTARRCDPAGSSRYPGLILHHRRSYPRGGCSDDGSRCSLRWSGDMPGRWVQSASPRPAARGLAHPWRLPTPMGTWV